jgi:tetratricopeptide (TPR) repeat protein
MSELRRAANLYASVANELDDPRERSQATTVRSTIAFMEGRYEDSEQLTNEALALGRESGDYNADLVFYAQGLLRAVDLGRATDVLPLLVDAVDFQGIASITAGTALCAALAGETEMAREYLDRLMATGFASYPRGADRLAPTAFLAHTCTLLGAVEHAEALSASLNAQGAVAVRVGPLLGWWGPVAHHVGGLYRLLGRLEEAEEQLRKALALEEQIEARPFRARTRAELARVLLTNGSSGGDELRAGAMAEAAALAAPGIVAELTTSFGSS